MAMNTSSVSNNMYSSYSKMSSTKKPDETVKGSKAEETKDSESARKSGNYGKTIGDAKLSKEGAAYYEKLKKQYGNMDFILVSEDQKANAQANIGKYANSKKMVVLIDEDKIERMATDENYRKQYEGIIKNASSGISQLRSKLEASGQGGHVLGYGMKIDDGGTASFFAIMKKSGDSQKTMMEKKVAKKKADKKSEQKKTEKKEKEERLKEKRLEKSKSEKIDDEDTFTIEASTADELLQKISDYNFNFMSDNVETEAESKIGHNIDFRG